MYQHQMLCIFWENQLKYNLNSSKLNSTESQEGHTQVINQVSLGFSATLLNNIANKSQKQ